MARMSLRSNRKFLRLCRDLNRPPYQVRGLLEMMWESGYENDVCFKSLDDAEIVSTWDGDVGVFGNAVFECGFLDKTSNGYEIHDHMEHAPYWWKERERKRKPKELSGKFPEDSGNIPGKSASSEAKRSVEKRREEKNKKPSAHPGFDEFYQAYPRHEGKTDALKAWNSTKPDLLAVLTALEWQRQKWTDPKYVPLPATYLRGRRWEDERTAIQPAPKKPKVDPSDPQYAEIMELLK